MNAHKQNGAALFISLMILFLMTIIGINALNTATTDERMALNTQHQQAVFHAAESAINVAKRDPNTLETAIVSGSSAPTYFTGQPDVTASATANYVGCYSLPPGFSTDYVNHEFAISGTAQLTNAHAQADHLQGATVIGPGGLDC